MDPFPNRSTPPRAFTLIELLVVIGIIGVLITMLSLGVGVACRSAERATKTGLIIKDTAGRLETHRIMTGGSYPSSGQGAGISCYESGMDDGDPIEDKPGFTFEPDGGGEYGQVGWSDGVSDSTAPGDESEYGDRELATRDGFGYPLLYYRANVGASRMTTTTSREGVYNLADNVMYTGDGMSEDGLLGVDLGAGYGHQLSHFDENGNEVKVDPSPQVTQLFSDQYQGTFARFIWNRKVTTRNEPVNKHSYLLISAGPDALWGTDDDITNFKRSEGIIYREEASQSQFAPSGDGGFSGLFSPSSAP